MCSVQQRSNYKHRLWYASFRRQESKWTLVNGSSCKRCEQLTSLTQAVHKEQAFIPYNHIELKTHRNWCVRLSSFSAADCKLLSGAVTSTDVSGELSFSNPGAAEGSEPIDGATSKSLDVSVKSMSRDSKANLKNSRNNELMVKTNSPGLSPWGRAVALYQEVFVEPHLQHL
jgi:hypothetical protein